MQTQKIEVLLANSSASDAFKKSVRDYAAGKQTSLIQHSAGVPRIKVIRVLTKLLEEFSDTAITDVHIDGASSCSGFSGILTFGPDHAQVQFNWDCSWKAEQAGYTTWYGEPDQAKAAEIFGYQCFKKFETITRRETRN